MVDSPVQLIDGAIDHIDVARDDPVQILIDRVDKQLASLTVFIVHGLIFAWNRGRVIIQEFLAGRLQRLGRLRRALYPCVVAHQRGIVDQFIQPVKIGIDIPQERLVYGIEEI